MAWIDIYHEYNDSDFIILNEDKTFKYDLYSLEEMMQYLEKYYDIPSRKENNFIYTWNRIFEDYLESQNPKTIPGFIYYLHNHFYPPNKLIINSWNE